MVSLRLSRQHPTEPTEPTEVAEVEPWPAEWLRGALEVCVLGVLDRGPTYGYAIAAALEDAGLGVVKGGTLYPLLGRLEAAGLVRREPNPDDRRGVHVALTEQGRELVDRAIAIRFAEAKGAVEGLDDRERGETAALLARLLAHLESDMTGGP